MNLLQLVLKQMRQRALGTWLTLLSVVLGVALAVAVLLIRRGGESLFSQTDYGYDLIIGKGSPTQLVLNTVYHIDQSPGNIPYAEYERISSNRRLVKQAVPIIVGDSYKRRRIVGTLPQMFGYDAELKRIEKTEDAFNYRPGKRFEFAEGAVFHPSKFEAVLGSEVTKLTGLKIGDRFQATHGAPAEGQKEHVHADEWRVVGVLKPTRTSNDRVIFIPLVTALSIKEHTEGMAIQSGIRAEQSDAKKTPATNESPAAPPGVSRTKPDADEERDHKHDPATKPDDDDHAEPSTKPDAHDDHEHKHEHKHDAPATKPGDHDHDHAEPSTKPDAHDDHEHDHDAPATKPDAESEGHDHHDHADDEHHEHTGGTGHAHEHETYSVNADGTIEPKLPKDQWLISAILVKARAPFLAQTLEYNVNAGSVATAVKPAMVMSQFFDTVFRGSTFVLLLISAMVSVVAAVGILVSIYNSVAARMREIAILRALGATKARILTLICVEAGLIGLVGGVLGWLVGHAIGAIGSVAMERLLGQGFNWMAVGWGEIAYLAGVVVIAVLAGLVPAMKAYRTPVATNLVAA